MTRAVTLQCWSARPLADCGALLSGGTPSRAVSGYWGGEIPWISAKSLKSFDVLASAETLTEAGASCVAQAPAGAVLFVVRGMSLANEFRVGVAGREVSFNQDVRALVPNEGIDGRYLGRFLQANESRVLSLVDAASHGTKRLTSDRFEGIEVPLPPLPEQRRIAEVLDRAEALRAKRRAALAKLDTLTQSIFLDMFGDPVAHVYPTVQVSECAEVVSGVAKGRKFNGKASVKIPYLRVANVQAGYLVLDEIKTIEALPAEVEELRLLPGDVVLTEGGDYDKLGRGAMWEGQVPNCIHQNHVFRVRVDQRRLLPWFFHEYLQSPVARAYFLACAKRTTNLASINMTQLRALPVFLPPVSLQEAFESRLDSVRGLVAIQRASLAKLDALFASLQHRAFRGEL